MLKIAILGAGHVGHACSADLSLAGHQVTLYELPEFAEKLKSITGRGGIEITGVSRVGLARLSRITSNIEEATKDVDIIQITVPAFGHKHMIEICAPHIEEGQTVLFCGCGGGTLLFVKTLREMGLGEIAHDILLGETNLPPYGTRISDPAQVSISFINPCMLAAAFPAKNTQKLLRVLRILYPGVIAASNVLETILCQTNFVCHPVATLLNVGRIEYSGPFPMWREGVTPSVAKLIEAVDKERLSVMRALGLKHLETYQELGALFGISTPAKTVYDSIRSRFMTPNDPTDAKKHRYVSEDVPYGLVTCASIGSMVDVDTPIIKALIKLYSVMNETDYWREGRTTEELGISGLSIDKLKKLVDEGEV